MSNHIKHTAMKTNDKYVTNEMIVRLQQEIGDDVEEECLHETIYQGESGDGYCVDCGRNFLEGDSVVEKCAHKNTYKSESGMYICRDCNNEIELLSQEAEWRYYGNGGGGASRDPARCHMRPDTKNLKKTFAQFGIDIADAIQNRIERDFKKIVDNKTLRGKNRYSLIAVCAFYAYAYAKEYRPITYFQKMFGITQREMSAKIKLYHETFPASKKIKVGPKHLIQWLARTVGIVEKQYGREILTQIFADLYKICDYIQGTSTRLNRSTPQSVASAVIYFYLRLKPEHMLMLDMSKSTFSSLVGSSEITINSLTKEIMTITRSPISLK